MSCSPIRLIAVLLVAIGSDSAAFAQPFTFTRLADSQTAMPGAPSGTQFLLLRGPRVSGNRVVFAGGVGHEGIYEWHQGTLVGVADTTTNMPNGAGTFTSLSSRGISGEHVVFGGSNGSQSGLYNRRNGLLGRVMDNTMAAPNGGTFLGVFSSAVEGNSIAFFAGHKVGSDSLPSIYRWDNGTITTVADNNTAVPGGTGTFQDVFNEVHLSQGGTSFRGLDGAGKSGIYRRNEAGLAVLADTNTDAPDGLGKFAYFDNFGITGNDLIVRATTQALPSKDALFTRIGGQWKRLLTEDDPAPGGGTFDIVSSLTTEDGISIFTSQGADGSAAVYMHSGDSIQRIIGFGDTLDGKTVRSAGLGGRDGNSLSVFVEFTDHAPPVSFDQAIYLVTIPAPSIVMVPFAGAAFLAARPRR